MTQKRTNGEGSGWYNDKRNRFEYSISYIDPITKVRKRKVFTDSKSLARAKKKGKAFLDEIATQKEKVDNKKMSDFEIPTIANWLMEWLIKYKKCELRPKTLERYEGLIQQNIIPNIGDTKINEISTSKTQEFLNNLLHQGGIDKKGLAPRSVNATRRLLVAALDDFIRINDASFDNKAALAKAVKVEKANMHIVSVTESKKIIKVALKYGYYEWLILKIAFSLGLRSGEIFGLRFSRINLEEKKITIDTTVVTSRHGIIIQPYTKKSASFRTIKIPDELVKAFIRFKLWVKVQDIRNGTNFIGFDWVFANKFGNPRSPSSFSGHRFKDIICEAGIDRNFRLHDCRHSVATWLCASADHLSLKVIGSYLGHASVRSTEVYVHYIERMSESAAESLNKLL